MNAFSPKSYFNIYLCSVVFLNKNIRKEVFLALLIGAFDVYSLILPAESNLIALPAGMLRQSCDAT